MLSTAPCSVCETIADMMAAKECGGVGVVIKERLNEVQESESRKERFDVYM